MRIYSADETHNCKKLLDDKAKLPIAVRLGTPHIEWISTNYVEVLRLGGKNHDSLYIDRNKLYIPTYYYVNIFNVCTSLYTIETHSAEQLNHPNSNCWEWKISNNNILKANMFKCNPVPTLQLHAVYTILSQKYFLGFNVLDKVYYARWIFDTICLFF